MLFGFSISAIFGFLKLGAVAAPLLYLLFVSSSLHYAERKNDALEIEKKTLSKQVDLLQGRLDRINIAGNEYKNALAIYERAIQRVGGTCEKSISTAVKREKDTKYHESVFGDGTGINPTPKQ